jgi:HAD superfamily hydrolase (TIGR01484 family)
MQPFRNLASSALARIHVLATDVDDTITSNGKIPPGTVELLQALGTAGIVVVLVTGRSAGWAQTLASYLPGIRLAIGENGLVAFDNHGVRMDLGPRRSQDFFARLTDNCARIRRAYQLQVTPDDAFRLFERAFIRPSTFDAAALAASQQLLDRQFEVMASSIHIHVRPAGWGKAEGLMAALEPLVPEAVAAPDEQILFVGDSSNDRSLFARLPRTSVGVSNVTRFLDELGEDKPAYITESESAQGFAEVARALLAAR